MKKTTPPKGKWTKTAESQVEQQIKEITKLSNDLINKIDVTISVPEKPKENIDILRELTCELEEWNTIYITKINLVKLQRFGLASEVRSIENESVSRIQKLAASLKLYPKK